MQPSNRSSRGLVGRMLACVIQLRVDRFLSKRGRPPAFCKPLLGRVGVHKVCHKIGVFSGIARLITEE